MIEGPPPQVPQMEEWLGSQECNSSIPDQSTSLLQRLGMGLSNMPLVLANHGVGWLQIRNLSERGNCKHPQLLRVVNTRIIVLASLAKSFVSNST